MSTNPTLYGTVTQPLIWPADMPTGPCSSVVFCVVTRPACGPLGRGVQYGQVMQTTLALQEKASTQLSLAVPLPKLSHAPAGAPPMRVSPEPKPVAAQVVQLNGASEVQIGQVHAKIENVEGQVGEMRGTWRGMLQALIEAQQKAPEHHKHQHHTHENSTATGTPSKLKKRLSQQSRPESAPRSGTPEVVCLSRHPKCFLNAHAIVSFGVMS